MALFRIAAPCSLVKVHQHFRVLSASIFDLTMEAESTSETSVNPYKITWLNIMP
jgi:hypothetical protein